mgnify:CR=1 FL=1
MKPDFLDIDGDGDKQESMKEASQEPDAQDFKDKKDTCENRHGTSECKMNA